MEIPEGASVLLVTEKALSRIVKQAVNQAPNEVPDYLTSKQAGKMIGVSASFIIKAKKDGLLDYYQPIKGGIVRFTKKHLDDFMKRREEL